jgi:hypothetical protein
MDTTFDDRARRLLAGRPGVPPPQRLVEIMTSGALNRVGLVRESLAQLQSQLLRDGGDSLKVRVTAFLDGCRHTTPWSSQPIDAGNSTQWWHCFEGETLFAQALQHSYDEREHIDAIVMFGDRFDDTPLQTFEIAKRLGERGTKIFAFHVGGKRNSRAAFERLAHYSGGVFVQLTGERAFARVVLVISDYLFRPTETLRALPSARDADVRALLERLKAQPAPALPLSAVGELQTLVA